MCWGIKCVPFLACLHKMRLLIRSIRCQRIVRRSRDPNFKKRLFIDDKNLQSQLFDFLTSNPTPRTELSSDSVSLDMSARRPRPRPVAVVGPILLATAAVALALLPITSPRTSPVCFGLLRGAHGLGCAAEAIPGNANRGLRGGCTEQCAAPTFDGMRWSGLRLWVRARVFVRGARWCPAGSRRCGNPHLRRNPCRSGGEWAAVLEQRRRELLEGGPARDLLDFLGSVACTLRPHRATSPAASRPSESPGAGLARHSSATGLASRAAASGDESTESEARSSRPCPAAKLVFWGGGAARGARCRSAGLTGRAASADISRCARPGDAEADHGQVPPRRPEGRGVSD